MKLKKRSIYWKRKGKIIMTCRWNFIHLENIKKSLKHYNKQYKYSVTSGYRINTQNL